MVKKEVFKPNYSNNETLKKFNIFNRLNRLGESYVFKQAFFMLKKFAIIQVIFRLNYL